MKTIRLIIKGKVQGVYFRASAKAIADRLGVKGWVKNLPDHSVEVKASGTEDQLRQIMEWCRQGPPGAIVEEVIRKDSEPEFFSSFEIIRSRFNFLF